MAIAATDLKLYGSATMPDDDTPTNIGGAISTAKKVEFTDITPAGKVEMLSSAAGDTTQTVTISYRDTAGAIQTEVQTLNGTTVVDFADTMDRILKIIMSATATGTITIRKDGDAGGLATLEPGITEVRRPFYNSSAPASGSRKYYEKCFFKNEHGTLTLTVAKVIEQADAVAKIAFGLPASKDDTGDNGANNRQVAPGGITFDSADKDLPGNTLAAGETIGVWLEVSLAAGDAPQDTTYTLRLQGNTT